jgi:serine/threonine-protein kinase
MELLEGQGVDEQLAKGCLPVSTALAIADQVLDALAAAHDAGVTHLDVKPGNVFRCKDGTVRLLDFGVAASGADGVGPCEGTAVGTPAFMSPEQTRGTWSSVDGRSDLWSVGATLFSMIAGRSVRRCDSTEEELRLAGTEPAISLGAVSDAPEAVVAFVDRALQFERSERFADAREMQAALRKVLADLPKNTDAAAAALSSVKGTNLRVPRPKPTSSSRTITLDAAFGRAPRRRFYVVGFSVAAAAMLLVGLGSTRKASSLLSTLHDAVSVSLVTSSPPPPLPSPSTLNVAMLGPGPEELAALLVPGSDEAPTASDRAAAPGPARSAWVEKRTTDDARRQEPRSTPTPRRRLRRAAFRPLDVASLAGKPSESEAPVADDPVDAPEALEPFDPFADRL